MLIQIIFSYLFISAEIQDLIHTEGLIYVTGYVAHRFRSKYTNLGSPADPLIIANNCPDWIRCLSKGGLIKPSDEFISIAKVLEDSFLAFHGPNDLSSEKQIFKKVAALTRTKLTNGQNDFIKDDALLCFVRTRTYIRLRLINRNFFLNKLRTKAKKMAKICN